MRSIGPAVTREQSPAFLHNSNGRLDFPGPTQEASLIPRSNSRKNTWFPRHLKMKPVPATASQEKSHVGNWRSKRYLAPLMRPTKFPGIPVSLERNTEVFRHHFHWVIPIKYLY